MPGTQIKVFDKIVEVIEVLASTSQGLTLRQVQGTTGLNKGTAFRILRCLEAHNLAARNADGSYIFGDRVFWWASRHEHSPELAKWVRPHLERLRDLTSETAAFNLLVGDRRVIVEQVTSLNVTSTRFYLGVPAPLHAGSSGRVILAHVDPTQRARILNQRLQRCTERTITDKKLLERELNRCIARGYAFSEGERLPNTSSLAAPIFGPRSRIIGALAVGGPSERFTAEKRKTIIPLLLKESRLLTEQLAAPWLANRRALKAL